MPRVNIYIRKEDEGLWAAIPDKPGWLHDRLNGVTEGIVGTVATVVMTEDGFVDEKKTSKKALHGVAPHIYCKHGAAPGLCKYTDCKNNKRKE